MWVPIHIPKVTKFIFLISSIAIFVTDLTRLFPWVAYRSLPMWPMQYCSLLILLLLSSLGLIWQLMEEDVYEIPMSKIPKIELCLLGRVDCICHFWRYCVYLHLFFDLFWMLTDRERSLGKGALQFQRHSWKALIPFRALLEKDSLRAIHPLQKGCTSVSLVLGMKWTFVDQEKWHTC